jgi:DNA-binding MarR family transcriptional regulator
MKRAAKHEIAPLLDDQSIGLEARMSSDDHHSLRLWLRLLACSTDIETEIRKRLRTNFGMTLARFDYLAQLHRHPDGVRMSALSRFLMVTGGNVTGLTDELEKDGLVQRDAEPLDRRSVRVALTAKGRKAFEGIASEHERWVIELFSGIDDAQRHQLHDLLGRLRVQLSARPEPSTVESIPS